MTIDRLQTETKRIILTYFVNLNSIYIVTLLLIKIDYIL